MLHTACCKVFRAALAVCGPLRVIEFPSRLEGRDWERGRFWLLLDHSGATASNDANGRHRIDRSLLYATCLAGMRIAVNPFVAFDNSGFGHTLARNAHYRAPESGSGNPPVVRHLLLSRLEGTLLVLSRKLQEQILVEEVVITVLEIRGRTVKIGIDAPRDVPIRREELQARESCQQRELACGHV